MRRRPRTASPTYPARSPPPPWAAAGTSKQYQHAAAPSVFSATFTLDSAPTPAVPTIHDGSDSPAEMDSTIGAKLPSPPTQAVAVTSAALTTAAVSATPRSPRQPTAPARHLPALSANRSHRPAGTSRGVRGGARAAAVGGAGQTKLNMFVPSTATASGVTASPTSAAGDVGRLVELGFSEADARYALVCMWLIRQHVSSALFVAAGCACMHPFLLCGQGRLRTFTGAMEWLLSGNRRPGTAAAPLQHTIPAEDAGTLPGEADTRLQRQEDMSAIGGATAPAIAVIPESPTVPSHPPPPPAECHAPEHPVVCISCWVGGAAGESGTPTNGKAKPGDVWEEGEGKDYSASRIYGHRGVSEAVHQLESDFPVSRSSM